jgi:CRISPR/Cas system-associated endonuclease Cas1
MGSSTSPSLAVIHCPILNKISGNTYGKSPEKKMELKMATLYLTEQQTLVKKEGDALAVHIPENKETGQAKKKIRVPLIKIDRVVVQGDSTLTSPAIVALMERHAEVTFLNRYGD